MGKERGHPYLRRHIEIAEGRGGKSGRPVHTGKRDFQNERANGLGIRPEGNAEIGRKGRRAGVQEVLWTQK